TAEVGPDAMFYFLHAWFRDPRTGPWGLIRNEIAGPNAQANFRHYEMREGTALFVPYTTKLAELAGESPNAAVTSQPLLENPCIAQPEAAGVWVSLERFSPGAALAQHTHLPGTDPAYSAGLSFSDVDPV